MAHRLSGIGSSIFYEMTVLAEQSRAVNLGQGFPDFPCPDFLKAAATDAIHRDLNQYAPSRGWPDVRRAVAAKVRSQYGLLFDPDSEILITHGATEAIFAAVLALVNPGDEVIVFEPYYDSYVPSTEIAGGVPKYCTLRSPDWSVPEDELAALFSDRTRLLILNTPQNPVGKVFTRDELQLIARLCVEHDVIAVVDEVYEHIVYDGWRHIPLSGMPGMADRTVTISSLGKTFSATGWKVGWVLARPALIEAVFRVHQFMVFAGAAPLQHAAATALAVEENYYADLAAAYRERRDFLVAALRAAGLNPMVPAGTYFTVVDIGGLGFRDDVAFCRHLTTQVGVACIPVSAFYHDPAEGSRLVRFAFCKSQATLETAAQRLLRLKLPPIS
jgi:aspartate/methionine/tyrosine aminotransferase